MKRDRPILEVSHLCIRRGRIRILDDINWRVRRGEHWGILGANGSGKTSLLGALTGYIMPTAGEIVVLGRRFGRSDWRELRKRIGLVGSTIRQWMSDDESALETVVSGRQAMIGLWQRVTRSERAHGLRWLRQVECADLAERPWGVLSQGERQRVLIARALMARPRLLILDEPCAGLDPVAREHFLQFLQRLGRREDSPALILVTHHVEEIMPVFSHVLLLQAGRLLNAGRKSAMLTTRRLSQAFEARVRLMRANGRYTLKVTRKEHGVV